MPLAESSILTILLKVPLLLCLVGGTYKGLTPPTKDPHANERKRASVPDFLTSVPAVQKASIAAVKWVFCTIALTEVVTLLSQLFPPDSSLPRLLALALPLAGRQRSGGTLTLTLLPAVGCIMGCLGGALREWCHRTLGYYFTWDIALRDNHKLITSGPYRIVRHPSYTGFYMIVFGNLLAIWSSGSFFVESGMRETVLGTAAVLLAMGYISIVGAGAFHRTMTEDRMLRKEFGTQWDEWARKTRYRLIPFVY